MNHGLKIAILELYYGQSGKLGFYNSQSVGLAKAYTKLGHEVFVVRPEKEIKEIHFEKIIDKITILNLPSKTLGVHSFFDLNFLIDYQIDLVHLNADNQAFVPYVIRFCKRNQIRLYNYVGTIHSDSSNLVKRLLLEYFSERNIRCFKKSITCVKTEAVYQELKNKNVPDLRIVPVGLDFDVIPEIMEDKKNIRKKLDLPADKKILLYVGRMSEYKNPLDALEIMHKMDESYYLVAIGKGELQKKFSEKILEYRLESRVQCIPEIANAEIHEYYRAADCFVNFNSKEIFGMSILEALYQECPVVARHAPGPDMILKDNETGYLCETIDQMCECIQQITPVMGSNGKKYVKERFSWSAASRIFLEEAGFLEKDENNSCIHLF